MLDIKVSAGGLKREVCRHNFLPTPQGTYEFIPNGPGHTHLNPAF